MPTHVSQALLTLAAATLPGSQMEWALLANAGATWFMVGLIWFVQLVHYPLFREAGRSDFHAYHRRHTARTTIIVAPVMLTEAVSSCALLWLGVDGAGLGCVLLAIAWLSTFAVQVPLHARLEHGHDAAIIRRLVRSNWIRTVAWSARGVLVLWMISDAFRR